MNTPTPETDAIANKAWISADKQVEQVPADFARKLERERDEARRQMWNRMPHMCRDGHQEIWHGDSENEMCPLCRALAERDELKLNLAYLEADNQQHIQRDMHRTGEVEQLRKVADELAAAAEDVMWMSKESNGIVGWHLNGDILAWEQVEFIALIFSALVSYRELPHVKNP